MVKHSELIAVYEQGPEAVVSKPCSRTGLKTNLQVASTAHLTHNHTHGKRGSAATDEIGILPQFQGRAMHDAWSPYFGYACAHGLCRAPHLCELTFVQEQMQQDWAKELNALSLEMKDVIAQAHAQGATSLLNEFVPTADRWIGIWLGTRTGL